MTSLTSSSPADTVQAQLAAYNAKNLDALLATFAADAEQHALHGELLARGTAQIGERYRLRFAEPDLHARLLSRQVAGPVVVDHELVTRNFAEGRGTLEMVCIYEVEGGLIRRASYSAGVKRLDTEASAGHEGTPIG